MGKISLVNYGSIFIQQTPCINIFGLILSKIYEVMHKKHKRGQWKNGERECIADISLDTTGSGVLFSSWCFWRFCREFPRFLVHFLQALVMWQCTKIDKYQVCPHNSPPHYKQVSIILNAKLEIKLFDFLNIIQVTCTCMCGISLHTYLKMLFIAHIYWLCKQTFLLAICIPPHFLI